MRQQQALERNPDLVFGDNAIRIYNDRGTNKDDPEPADDVHVQFVGSGELSETENDKIVGPISEKLYGQSYNPMGMQNMNFSEMLKKAELEEPAEPIGTVMEKRHIEAPEEDAEDPPVEESHHKKHHQKKGKFGQKVNDFLDKGTDQEPMHF